jgi:hypothetical protein
MKLCSAHAASMHMYPFVHFFIHSCNFPHIPLLLYRLDVCSIHFKTEMTVIYLLSFFSFTISQIFQHPLNDKVSKTVPSSVASLLESPVASTKGTDNRTGDASAVAGTEMLASTSNQSKDLPAAPSLSAGENSQRVVRPTAAAADKSKGCCNNPDKDCGNGENANDVNSNIENSSLDGTAASVSPDAVANDTCQHNGSGPDAHLGAEIGKIATYKIRPVLRMIRGSNISEFDLTGDLFKALEDQRDLIRDLNTSASVPPSRCQAFKVAMKQAITSPSDIDATFENFPYYLR